MLSVLVLAALRAPPPRPTDPNLFASPAAWDRAYAEVHPGDEAEWLMSYNGPLQKALCSRLSALERDASIMELGCGNSDLCARLALNEGFSNLLVTDASPTAVNHAQHRYAGIAGLRFAVEDAKRLRCAAGSLGAVVDKGTLDAICSGEGFDCEARAVASSVARALRPGGVWLSVSLMPPNVIGARMKSCGRAETTHRFATLPHGVKSSAPIRTSPALSRRGSTLVFLQHRTSSSPNAGRLSPSRSRDATCTSARVTRMHARLVRLNDHVATFGVYFVQVYVI
jgi:SAM-dependent methyltransferase